MPGLVRAHHSSVMRFLRPSASQHFMTCPNFHMRSHILR
jgi:hypothetical protein